MFAKNNQISGRQATRLILFDLLGYSALLVPAALSATAGRDGIFSIAIGVVAGFLYLRILKAVMQEMQGNYGECLIANFGPLLGNILKAGYLLYFLLLAGRVSSILAELVVNELLEKQFRLILFIILALVYYGVSGGIEGRARVYEILFWILLITLFGMMLFAVPAVDADYWSPVLMESPKEVLSGGYQVFLCISVLFLLPFLAEYVSEKGQVYRSGKCALAITGAILGTLYLLLLGLFGEKALATLDYPVVTMMSRIQITGGFLKRIDAFMFGIWFFTLYALINSLIFFAGRLWPMKKRGERFWLLGEVAVTFALADVFYHSEVLKNYYEKFFLCVGTPFVIVVSLLVYLIQRGKKLGSREKHLERGGVEDETE